MPITGSSNSSSVSIPQLSTDPVSPTSEQSWVLCSTSGGNVAGNSIGLLLALTYAASSGGTNTYQFSYQTVSDGIKRVFIT